jgi:hypothetical protein
MATADSLLHDLLDHLDRVGAAAVAAVWSVAGEGGVTLGIRARTATRDPFCEERGSPQRC